jgi:DNA repair exonuclease SbcCD ATPase subunit
METKPNDSRCEPHGGWCRACNNPLDRCPCYGNPLDVDHKDRRIAEMDAEVDQLTTKLQEVSAENERLRKNRDDAEAAARSIDQHRCRLMAENDALKAEKHRISQLIPRSPSGGLVADLEVEVERRFKLEAENDARALELERLRARAKAWEDMAELRNKLLAHYRIGTHPSEALMKRLDKATAAIKALHTQETKS